MIAIRLLAAVSFAAGAALSGAAAAHAEPGAFPVGTWVTPDLRSQLQVGADGNCVLSPGRGQLDRTGPCTWAPYHQGGVLTISSDNPAVFPDPIPYQVLWIGGSSIMVNSDLYGLRT